MEAEGVDGDGEAEKLIELLGVEGLWERLCEGVEGERLMEPDKL